MRTGVREAEFDRFSGVVGDAECEVNVRSIARNVEFGGDRGRNLFVTCAATCAASLRGVICRGGVGRLGMYPWAACVDKRSGAEGGYDKTMFHTRSDGEGGRRRVVASAKVINRKTMMQARSHR